MNTQAKDLLSIAPKTFDDLRQIQYFDVKRIQDSYGYQYIIKGNPTNIRGSIHTESFLEENVFGLADGFSIIISTEKQLKLGNLIEYNSNLYAIKEQTSFNKVLDLKHFVCENVLYYYQDFIVDTEDQINKILGSDSTRFILDFGVKNNIPIIPSQFKPIDNQKYIAINVFNTRSFTAPYKNTGLFIEQAKQDDVMFLALNFDTNELQDFAFDIFEKSKNYGFALGSIPNFQRENRYNKAFDLKANLWRCDTIINYKITTTNKREADKLISKVLWDFNFN